MLTHIIIIVIFMIIMRCSMELLVDQRTAHVHCSEQSHSTKLLTRLRLVNKRLHTMLRSLSRISNHALNLLLHYMYTCSEYS